MRSKTQIEIQNKSNLQLRKVSVTGDTTILGLQEPVQHEQYFCSSGEQCVS
jgi:hypothetical protein